MSGLCCLGCLDMSSPSKFHKATLHGVILMIFIIRQDMLMMCWSLAAHDWSVCVYTPLDVNQVLTVLL